MRIVKFFGLLLSAVHNWFLQLDRQDTEETQRPPIRYYGDPTKIYLA